MNLKDLAEELERGGVRRDSYSLDGGHQNDTLCVDRRGDLWVVYYSERGREWDLQTFTSESAACAELRTRLFDVANTGRASAYGEYSLLLASDIRHRDGIGLELYRGNELVAEVFRNDDPAWVHVRMFEQSVPFETMRWFMEMAAARLGL